MLVIALDRDTTIACIMMLVHEQSVLGLYMCSVV
jgi:hypothetical protein